LGSVYGIVQRFLRVREENKQANKERTGARGGGCNLW